MFDIKSVLASRPALEACVSSASICAAIKPASAEIRSDFSLSVPSCFWKRTVSKLSRRLSRVSFLSLLKKNSASARRGRITFSLPEIICEGSRLSILVTNKKVLERLPSLSSNGTYFWSSFMV